MAENKHVYLKNINSHNDGFKKTRNAGPKDEEPEFKPSKFPNPSQQLRLRKSNASFYLNRKLREERKTLQIPLKIELIELKFYKAFSLDLQKKYSLKYGLEVSVFSDFNKTALFEIFDSSKFDVFINHLKLFYESEASESYEGKVYNLIALIHDFRFLTSKRRIVSYSDSVSSFCLIPSISKKGDELRELLIQYFKEHEKTIFQTQLSPEYIEVEKITKEELQEIVDNFDNVKVVSSSRTERRRPGEYGTERREHGFTLTVPESITTVGLIDTGLHRIEPYRDIVSGIEYDLTGNGVYWDESGHGTAVAGLIAIGQEFLMELKDSYLAKAKIAVIKAIQNDHDSINVVALTDAIIDARLRHGIRIFNLSMNDPMPKGYNTAFSEYAYLLDKVSFEYDVLIFISVGNIPERRLRELIEEEPHVSHEYPNVFYSLEGSDIHSCESTNISEPSESLNNMSVGALAGNLESGLTSDITPAEEFPAYYTRKFHYDYEQSINGSDFIKTQRNKYLNKPDLVFDGGDLFKYESGMEVLSSSLPSSGTRFFSRTCGTSLSTPLVTSMAAEILNEYPSITTQSVKALLINSANSPCGQDPPLFRDYPINLLRKLIGFGKPQRKGLIKTNNNSITFIIEDEIQLEELRTIPIALPTYINKSGNKLNFTGTLSYSFLPIKNNHLSYLPLQITFGIFKPIEASVMGPMKVENYRIKPGITWSDDFFGVDNRLFSNVQKISDNVAGDVIEELGNKISLAIKCTAKNEIPNEEREYLEKTKHKFSLVLTVTELPDSRANNRLYHDLIALNTIENIIDVSGEASIDLDV